MDKKDEEFWPSDSSSFKAILLGDNGVGKTNLIQVALGNDFQEKSDITWTVSNLSKTIIINGKEYTLDLWDTIGMEKFRSVTRIFYKDSKIIILVYDKSRKLTFENLSYWINEITHLKRDDYVLAIVGNKDDLDDVDTDVNENEAKILAKELNAKFRMVSAKVDPRGFVYFLTELLKDYLMKNKIIKDDNNSIALNKKKIIKKNKCRCLR